MMGRNHLGQTAALRPFMGIMGMPLNEPGIHSTVPPRITGGNLDCKELVVGSTLYLPIEVAGGLFSTGDGHAAQGDGEIGGTAIECPMDLVELKFHLRDSFPVKTPVAKTPVGWLTMGFHASLNEAAFMAVEAMLTLMEHLYQLDRLEVVALASHAVDLRVTQIVNEIPGVHAILPHGRCVKGQI
jgi:acetamidase/formamidase